MSVQFMGFVATANESSSYFVFAEPEGDNGDRVRFGARYRNLEANTLYEIVLDLNDLETVGNACITLAQIMQGAKE